MVEYVQQWLGGQGLSTTPAHITAIAIGIAVLAIFSLTINFIAKRILLSVVKYIVTRSEIKWDDILLERKVFNQLAHLAPAVILYNVIPLVFEGSPRLIGIGMQVIILYIILVTILALDAFINAVYDISHHHELTKEIPIKGFVQVAKIILYFIGGIFIIAQLLDKSPLFLLSGLGALTAVLLFVFKDVILGFIAGIQLSANKMVMPGDWIEMPKYGADGPVLEIALTTVKVRNWDKTITTIPTYALISDSFKNWRGMQESGGRRIKRAIYLDMNSIRFCDEEMIERFSKIRYIADYIQKKKKELADYNAALEVEDVDTEMLVNRRRLTNIGTFRAYVTGYLKHHPQIRQDMTFIIRQLAPTEHGLPIEIYVFVNDVVWANYEAVQSDIFDHILSIIPEFDLRVYQSPSGADLRNMLSCSSSATDTSL